MPILSTQLSYGWSRGNQEDTHIPQKGFSPHFTKAHKTEQQRDMKSNAQKVEEREIATRELLEDCGEKDSVEETRGQ